jgi:excisionase family DNA binding protein
MKTLLNVKEVAEQLGIKPSTVRAWLAARKLPRVYCGRCVRVPAEAVTQFIATHTIPQRTDRR